jgi:hypothetical protein
MKIGEKIICIDKSFQHFTFDAIYEIEDYTDQEFSVVNNKGEVCIFDRSDIPNVFFKFLDESKNNVELDNEPELKAPKHYNNTHGSLYDFAWKHGLNAWEFDIVKRIARCRHKGSFREDLEKTKFVIDLYLKEFKND